MKTRTVLLFSGGLDSYILWHMLDYPALLYVAMGHKYQVRELAGISRLADELHRRGYCMSNFVTSHRLNIGDLEQDDGHIPLRNLLLYEVAALEFPDATNVYFGALRGEASRDKSKTFIRKASQLIGYSDGLARLSAPARHLTKTQLVGYFLRNYPSLRDTLSLAVSCYAGNDLPSGVAGCGVCQSCFRRWVAMENNGIVETYLQDPGQKKFTLKTTLFYLIRSDPREWFSIAVNNLDAYKALSRRG